MRGKKILTPEIIRRAQELQAGGLSYRRVSEVMGISHSTLQPAFIKPQRKIKQPVRHMENSSKVFSIDSYMKKTATL